MNNYEKHKEYFQTYYKNYYSESKDLYKQYCQKNKIRILEKSREYYLKKKIKQECIQYTRGNFVLSFD